jgi:cytosine/uracil/thiamine/allantoin permease
VALLILTIAVNLMANFVAPSFALAALVFAFAPSLKPFSAFSWFIAAGLAGSSRRGWLR